jgi:hypothetical protein
LDGISGSLREGLGGLADAAKGNSAGERLTNRSAYLVAVLVRTGIMGAITYYLLNGKAPQTIKDYFFPNGHSMPGFAKDAVNWATHPVDTASGKIHPLLSLLYDFLSNEDHYGRRITKKDLDTVQHWLDLAEYSAKQAIPISIQGWMKNGKIDEDAVFQFFGMPKEPRAIREKKRALAAH